MKRYIAIDLVMAKELKISLNEWVLLENIYFMSNNSVGYCYASKKTFAEILQVSRRTAFRVITDLIDKKYLEKVGNSSNLKVTEKWINISNGNSAKSALISELDRAKFTLQPCQNGTGIVPNLHTKEDIKRENKREALAIDFLKQNNPLEFESFLIQNKKLIKQFEKFEADFNDTVDIEKLPFDQKVLFARLRKYARNYIANQNKFNAPEETNVIPIYRRKIS